MKKISLTASEILNSIAQPDTTWRAKAEWREENKDWLAFSAKIAIKILSALRQNRIEGKSPNSQKELADQMGMTPQQVNKIVKGHENLTTETIFRIQEALSIQLIQLAETPIKKSNITDIQFNYITTNDGGYVTNTTQVSNLPQTDKIQAGNTSYAMAA